MINIPDRWEVLEFHSPSTGDSIRKVFSGWYGGYTEADHWKINSGIIKTEDMGEFLDFESYSGSLYRCYRSRKGMTALMHGILTHWKTQIAKGELDVQVRILDLEEILNN